LKEIIDIRQQQQDRNQNTQQTITNSQKSKSEDREFERGQRIFINNKVKLPKGRSGKITYKDRVGEITSVVADIVSFRTDKGTETWRLKKNLILLPKTSKKGEKIT